VLRYQFRSFAKPCRYLSTTATLLFISYQLHNVVSWLKIRPFLPNWGSRFFIGTLVLVQPFWIVEAWSNFEYFNSLGSQANEKVGQMPYTDSHWLKLQTRPWEALVRDPWWIFTTWKLIDAIKKTYGFKLWALIRINRRFGVMLACMFISIAFLLTDVIVSALKVTKDSGINPYWRFALVFKCASDTIFLDDFKSVLDDIITKSFNNANGTAHRGSFDRRKSSATFRNGSDFIEVGPMTTSISSPQPTMAHNRLHSPFKHQNSSISIPKIHIQKETSVTSEARKPSQESYGSDREMLPVPEPAVHGKFKDTEESNSLAIVRGGHKK
jgi:hypothetical protein